MGEGNEGGAGGERSRSFTPRQYSTIKVLAVSRCKIESATLHRAYLRSRSRAKMWPQNPQRYFARLGSNRA